ncbi:DJ-1/PfpI family protein [Advenella mimigardefordensis]|uniref:Putative transcriptional regulator, DJ-1/PfpI family n=1 Tax=Advenella mimigardefordensis (strain DSM 17166 / LMG 22922 / DPN7) TaxID=1247726 RepID=W0PDJ5_ADVMD|nr:DJ-1/PfpI family protein [Advenella mimigardefordensis]AHG64944.1 putative transcriptional regulator, DJ-1/PfpI family [Advenella mimigardefordensis DPN7]
MKFRVFMLVVIGFITLSIIAGAVWLLSLPVPGSHTPAPGPDQDEYATTLAALAPAEHRRPLIAIIGINDATETTDYLMPYGILKRADIADVMTLATHDGPVSLYPALTVQPDTTVAQFDRRYPDGADYVIVPAMSRDDDPAVMAWLQQQKAKGAIIIGVCAGAKVVAEAGLLNGKRATTHWYYLKELLQKHPDINYVANRRWVIDNGVVTTTGITASIPTMLTLIEAIAGREKAQQAGQDLGVMQWSAAHDSQSFRFTRPFALTVIQNTMAFWHREKLLMPLHTGIDEVALAMVADAWTRTYRSRVATSAPNKEPIISRNGMHIIADAVSTSSDNRSEVPAVDMAHPATALTDTLGAISKRYGEPTARVVAMQLEYPWPGPKSKLPANDN